MEKIVEKTFISELIREWSYGVVPIGKHKSTMTLYRSGIEEYFIEWDVPALDESYEIGLKIEGQKVVGYDGIMSLPEQAINLLKEQGFDTQEVE
jgi:hypothetical protein